MLRSHTLMLDNTLIPAYQERVASHTFNTDEHTSEHDDDDDDDEEQCEQSLLMTGTGRRAGKERKVNSLESVYCSSSVSQCLV